MMLNKKRSDTTLEILDSSNRININKAKNKNNPVKILSELTHRFYNEKLPKSPQQLMSPRSNNSGSNFRAPQVVPLRQQLLEKSRDTAEECQNKLSGLLLISRFGSTFQRNPSRTANANTRSDLEDVGTFNDGLPFLPLDLQQPLDLAQLTAIYKNLMGFDMLHAPHIEEQMYQCQQQLMNAVGLGPRADLNPIYEDEASQENTMQHESVKL